MATAPLPDPHIRMMGASLFQRSNLTVNNGKFYIDTTVSEAEQRKTQNHVNVFTAGETYHLFLLFAKADTRQTYQLFVGKNAPADFLFNNVVMNRADPKVVPYRFTEELWPEGQWERTYDPESGILSVTMELSDIQSEIDDAIEKQCLPKSVCTFKNNECVTSLTPGDYLFDEFVQGKICANTALAVDCPDGGCYGFSVTLPEDFLDGLTGDPRPEAESFSSDNENFNWNVRWKKPADDSDLAGVCRQDFTAL